MVPEGLHLLLRLAHLSIDFSLQGVSSFKSSGLNLIYQIGAEEFARSIANALHEGSIFKGRLVVLLVGAVLLLVIIVLVAARFRLVAAAAAAALLLVVIHFVTVQILIRFKEIRDGNLESNFLAKY